MKYKLFFAAILVSFLNPIETKAQKTFSEGVIVYNISLETSDANDSYTGTYTFTIKGKQVRKELKMNNGFDDIIITDFNTNSVYSLKVAGDKKYAIQLDMDDITSRCKQYENFTVSNANSKSKKIAGLEAENGIVTYRDGSTANIYYTNAFVPDDKWTFDRFPGIKYLPLSFSYKDANGMVMHFEAKKVDLIPVDNVLFRIPTDYKTITYTEYKQLEK